jgi:RNA polymerase sigma-70 factor, ECF subfamily
MNPFGGRPYEFGDPKPKSASLMALQQEPPTDVDDDPTLLGRIVGQDRVAFEQLYRRYYRRLFHFVLRMVRREELAEEVVGDAMFAVWRGAGTFEGGSSVSTWMFAISYRQALKALERDRKHSVVDSDDEALVSMEDSDPAANPESAVASDAETLRLQEAIASLGEHHRVVVELTALGHSYPEIAKIVGVPENTVKTRMFHARQLMKRFLGRLEHNKLTTLTGTNRSWTRYAQTV